MCWFVKLFKNSAFDLNDAFERAIKRTAALLFDGAHWKYWMLVPIIWRILNERINDSKCWISFTRMEEWKKRGKNSHTAMYILKLVSEISTMVCIKRGAYVWWKHRSNIMIPPANAYKHTKQWFNCSSNIKQRHKTYTAVTATSHYIKQTWFEWQTKLICLHWNEQIRRCHSNLLDHWDEFSNSVYITYTLVGSSFTKGHHCVIVYY